MNNRPSVCLLLTATIDPKNISFMKRDNPLIREMDYLVALQQYCKLKIPFVFCENSDYDLTNIKQLLERTCTIPYEVLQYEGQDFPRTKGKGYGEMQTLSFAILNSKIIDNSVYIIKINGRYFIKNIRNIISKLKGNNVDVYADFSKNLTFADSRVFIFTKDFFSNFFQKRLKTIDDSKNIYFEHVLANAIHESILNGSVWNMLPESPILIGFSGTNNSKYKNSFYSIMKSKLSHKLRRKFIMQ